MRKEIADKLEQELADWKRRLQELRVKAKLGSLEMRDKERKLIEEFEPAYEEAMKKLAQVQQAAGAEAKALRSGLEAGWRELRRAYGEARKSGPKD